MDETELFFRQTENKRLFERGEKCSGGKKVKLRMTVSLCSSLLGEKVKPLVIWRYANPHCFKGIKKNQLSVEYYSNKNAWMTSGVFETWLKKLNRKMASEKRKMLFLDNASSHPTIDYSNVKLQFFPPNTTSMLQPMNQWIIQTTKLKLRKLQRQKHDHRYGNA